jgi:hypothetical protein
VVGRLQQDSSAIRAALPLVKLGHHGLGKNIWEQQTLRCGILGQAKASSRALNAAFTTRL